MSFCRRSLRSPSGLLVLAVLTLATFAVQAASLCTQTQCEQGGVFISSNGTCSCSAGVTGDCCAALLGACEKDSCKAGECSSGGPTHTCNCPSGVDGLDCSKDILDECAGTNPCHNEGTCLNHLGKYSCLCPYDVTGDRCQTIQEHCIDNVKQCYNGGTCVNTIAGFECKCPEGFLIETNCKNNDPCLSNPCPSNSTCLVSATYDSVSFYCGCPTGYTGTTCEVEIDECSTPGVCQNGASCVNTPGSFLCHCALGYTGALCESDIDECSPNPCVPANTTCVNLINSFRCNCSAGYTGVRCETNINDCSSNPCNNGTCVDLLAKYVCNCDAGFRGTRCEENINECVVNPTRTPTCDNGGTCVDAIAHYTCQCPFGYTGAFCETDIDECAASPCKHGGTCLDRIGHYKCQCTAGWTGATCTADIQECLSQPCKNNGTCHESVHNAYTCNCLDGFTGTHCETDVNECLSSPCQHGATCQDLRNDYHCTCPPGYLGKNCSNNIDECHPSPCHHNATCRDKLLGFDCLCTAGYTGKRCESDVNECSSNPCQHNSTCYEPSLNIFACSCSAGFTGTHCETDVDECLSSPCQHDGTCQDLLGGYLCTCQAGYSGKDCSVDIDECISMPCHHNSTCRDKLLGFECLCPAGYTGTCCESDINECSPNPCQHNGTCTHQLRAFNRADYVCLCKSPYTGVHCETSLDDCHLALLGEPGLDVCLHGGTCLDGNGQYTCRCLAGYTGRACETDINECIPGPCANGGLCQDGVNAFTCVCPVGFTGHMCETNINECAPNPCLNGNCTDLTNDFTCTCQVGFTGHTCEININECASRPCRNGNCTDLTNSFTCTCQTGFTGHTCETSTNTCASNPCFNGKCTDLTNNFTCTCQVGFTGHMCETNINECASSPCLNNGNCTDLTNNFTCTCQMGFTGHTCETNIDECAPSPCLHGNCIDLTNNFTCSCHPGFTGPTCQTEMNECSSSPCHHGTCSDLVNAFHCNCTGTGYEGEQCASAVDDCVLVNRCVSDHTVRCVDEHKDYKCLCKAGFTGKNCQTQIDFCATSQCGNGTCQNRASGYECACSRQYTGKHCNVYMCSPSDCNHHGSCLDHGQSVCQCSPGFTGKKCQTTIDFCSSSPCINGTCQGTPHGYHCTCQPQYTGKHCDVYLCKNSPCLHGKCSANHSQLMCECDSGYTGRHCESEINECLSSPCRNGASCHDGTNSYRCTCSDGYHGDVCQFDKRACDDRSTCPASPCKNLLNGSYLCQCSAGLTGRQCEINIDDCLPGVCGINSCIDGKDFHRCSPPGKEPSSCPEECKSYADGFCDKACDTEACAWDRGDCTFYIDPWSRCKTVRTPSGKHCWQVFADKHCDQVCHTEACNWDGRDCAKNNRTCPAQYMCSKVFSNSHCDYQCNNPECGWDGGHCQKETRVWAHGKMWILLDVDIKHFSEEMKNQLMYNMSALLHSVVTVKTADAMTGHELEEWIRHHEQIDGLLLRRRRGDKRVMVFSRDFARFNYTNVTAVLDITECVEARNVGGGSEGSCFENATDAARYIAAVHQTFPAGVSLSSVVSTGGCCDKPAEDQSKSSEMVLYLASGGGFLLLLAIIGVIGLKRVRARVWQVGGDDDDKSRPPSQRKSPVGEEQPSIELKIKPSQVSPVTPPEDEDASLAKRPCMRNGWTGSSFGSQSYISRWQPSPPSDDGTSSSESDRTSSRGAVARRRWTVLHMDAANVGRAQSSYLTPPSDSGDSRPPLASLDVNVCGPDNTTPLMVAAMQGCHSAKLTRNTTGRSPGKDSEVTSTIYVNEATDDIMNEEKSNSSYLQQLLEMGASVNLQTESRKETALHLAARSCRVDHASQLLAYGADPNAKDINGATPLHSAVGSSAMGVSQVLLIHRSTDVDAQADDGSTALMIAARNYDNELIELILKHNPPPKVNTIDRQGWSALHWAAAVNNRDGAQLLLKHGAQKDNQNHKGETALFLAAKEGAAGTVRVLLEHFANRNIPDNMERTPLDMACSQHGHSDIVALLEDMTLGAGARHPVSPVMMNAAMATASRGVPFTGQPPGSHYPHVQEAPYGPSGKHAAFHRSLSTGMVLPGAFPTAHQIAKSGHHFSDRSHIAAGTPSSFLQLEAKPVVHDRFSNAAPPGANHTPAMSSASIPVHSGITEASRMQPMCPTSMSTAESAQAQPVSSQPHVPAYQYARQTQQRHQLVHNQRQRQGQWPVGNHSNDLNMINEEDSTLGLLLTPGEEQYILHESQCMTGCDQDGVPAYHDYPNDPNLLDQLTTTTASNIPIQQQSINGEAGNIPAIHHYPTPSSGTGGSPFSSDGSSSGHSAPTMTQNVDPRTPDSGKSSCSASQFSCGHSWSGSSPHSHGNSWSDGTSPPMPLGGGVSPPSVSAELATHLEPGYTNSQAMHRLSHIL